MVPGGTAPGRGRAIRKIDALPVTHPPPGRSLQPAQKPSSGRHFPADSGPCPYRSTPIRDGRNSAHRFPAEAGAAGSPAGPDCQGPARNFDSVRNGCRQRCRRGGHVPRGLIHRRLKVFDHRRCRAGMVRTGRPTPPTPRPCTRISARLASGPWEIVVASWTGRRTRRKRADKGSSGRDERQHREASWPSATRDGRAALAKAAFAMWPSPRPAAPRAARHSPTNRNRISIFLTVFGSQFTRESFHFLLSFALRKEGCFRRRDSLTIPCFQRNSELTP